MSSGLWTDGPGGVFAPHSHPYHKSLRCVKGSITFTILGGDAPRDVLLRPGDTLEIAAETPHCATVGPEGVTCAETQRFG